ncbi:MAG: OmpA family protein [Bacteroidota bacterium]
MNFKKYVHIILFALTLSIYGQNKKSKGDDFFFSYAFKDAIVAYENDLTKGFELSAKQYLNLADSYFKVENYERATKIYLQLFSKDSIMGSHHLNKLLQGLGKKADLTEVQEFLEDEGVAFHKELLENGDFNMKLLASNENGEANNVQIFNLESNSQSNDFSPSFFNDFLLFTSGRPTGKRKSYKPTGEAYLDIFRGTIAENGQISDIKPFKEVPDSDYHKATPYYSSDLNAILYVLSNTTEGELEFDENGKNALGIGIQKLNGGFNFLWRDLSTSFYYPFYEKETARLYFAANLDDSYGGTDLYYVNTNQGQVMSAPINLGPRINSPGNEIAPYVFEGALYFSSDVFYGLGGMDIYKANIREGNFTIPINLGKPVNSEADDFGYILKNHREGLLGYFSSNRKGGVGNDDVYGFLVDEKPGLKTLALTGKVVKLGDLEGVESAVVRVYGPDGSLLQETSSNDKGAYIIEVPWQSMVRVEATKQRYSIFSAILDEEQMEAAQNRSLNLGLASYDDLVEEREKQKVVKLKDFYFPKGRSTVMAEIATELDKVVDFVQRFPAAQLRIETHTDSRGGSSTNFRITQARSDAIKRYLLEKGVPASNILYAVGYGEEKIVNNCKNGVYCIEMLHKKNQRSLIVVLNDNILFN